MEEDGVLAAPPRTLDVKQFARARAAELASLHATLSIKNKKEKKRKAQPHDEQVDGHDAGCSGTSLPRHLRRRTTSYSRRRRPLPWLYKKKRTSSALVFTKKHCKRQQAQQNEVDSCHPHLLRDHNEQVAPEMGGHDIARDGIGISTQGANINEASIDDILAPVQTSNHASQQQAIAVPFQEVRNDVGGSGKAQVRILGVQEGAISRVNEDVTALTCADSISFLVQVDSYGVQQEATSPHSQVHISDVAPMDVNGSDALVQEEHMAQVDGATNMACTCVDVYGEAAYTRPKKKLCRRLRRLIEFKPGGSLMSCNGTRRLATHVWHAKRLAMEKKWGYYIPIGRPGRGHGSRSVLRWSKDKALLQDASFYNAIQLHGQKERIMQVLRLVLELPVGMDSHLEAAQTGRCFSTTMVHHDGQAPHKFISPVILMWKPVPSECSTPVCGAKKNGDLEEQDLWLWVHAAAFEQAFQVLVDISGKLNQDLNDNMVHCFSRRGDLGRLDLIGDGAFEVIQKVLFPVSRDQQGNCAKLHELAEVVKLTQMKENVAVHMEVSDPRLKQSERSLALDPVLVPSATAHRYIRSEAPEVFEGDGKIKEGGWTWPEHAAPDVTFDTTVKERPEEYCCDHGTIDSLWACESSPLKCKLRLPVKEKFLSRMRHTDRLYSFGLTNEIGRKDRMLERRKDLRGRFICPVILINYDFNKASTSRWSIILPLRWILSFWVPLVFAGGHVIGIRERHWLDTNAGCASFPEDFPDSKAFTELMTAKSCPDARIGRKRFAKKTMLATLSESIYEDMVDNMGLGLPDGCFVARTPESLVNYLEATHQRSLVLFPAQSLSNEKFKALGRRLHEGTVVWHAKSPKQEATDMDCVKFVCLLRVSICPFRKGVAEVGSKIYAPTSEDYDLWSCCMESKSTTTCTSNMSPKRVIGFVTSM